MKRFTIAATLLAGFAAQPVMAEMNSPQAARHVLSLNDVEITALIDDVSIITGYTFILHPDVRRTKVTVMSQTPMSTDDVFQVFLSTLRVHGFAAIPAGKGVYRIVPEQAAIGEATGRDSGPNAFITQVLKLDSFSAIEAAQMIKPLVDAQGQVVANARSNTLVVVDYASNMPRLRELVASLDSGDRSKIETIALKNIPAREMEVILGDLLGETENGTQTNFEVTSSQTSNSIIIRGDELSVAKAMRVTEQLDQADPVHDTLRVIPLRNSNADEIVPVLEKISLAMVAQAKVGDTAAPGATIAHHEPSNSLVISAAPETLLAMERVVEQLDRRRAQVLVEAIIVEVSDDTARELGVQFLLSGTGESSVPFLSTNFSNTAPNLLQLAGAIAGDSAFGGTNPFTSSAVTSLLGLEGVSVGGGGRSGDKLFGAILTAVEADTNSRVLSKPFSMTLDNGKSELVVGQNIPVTTGSTLGDSNSNPFTTVERQEVGIKLNVTPRISQDDTIQMEIYQEVSSVAALIGDTSSNPILNTRQFTTNVIADDGEIIVIGGLIEQSDTTVNTKVPLLGDIPVMGNLFKSEGRDLGRTNLMVFIKPTIVRNRDDARNVTSRSYRYIRAEEFLREDGGSSLDDFMTEVLGDVPPIN